MKFGAGYVFMVQNGVILMGDYVGEGRTVTFFDRPDGLASNADAAVALHDAVSRLAEDSSLTAEELVRLGQERRDLKREGWRQVAGNVFAAAPPARTTSTAPALEPQTEQPASTQGVYPTPGGSLDHDASE